MGKSRFIRYRLVLVLGLLPCVAMAESSIELVKRLYPGLQGPMLKAKLNASRDIPEFFKNFSALYYEYVASQEGQSLVPVKELSGDNAWCAGDAVIQNFGPALEPHQSATFTLVDLAESGPCPAVASFLQLLTSASLAGFDRGQLEKLVENYQNGLETTPHFSSLVTDLVEEARSQGYKALKGELAAPNRLKRTKDNRELNATEQTEISRSIRIIDGYSLGAEGYRVLTRVGEDSTPVVLELVPLFPSAVESAASTPVPLAEQRILNSVKLTRGPKTAALYKAVTVRSKKFLLRPRWAGSQSLELKTFKDKKLTVVLDEVAALAQIQRRSVYNPSGYAKAVQKVRVSAWIEAARHVANHIRLLYAQLAPSQ